MEATRQSQSICKLNSFHLDVRIWTKQSHGLFDFSDKNKQLKTNQYLITPKVQIIIDVDKEEVFFSRSQLTRYLSRNIAVLSYDPLKSVFRFTNPLEDDNIKNKLWKYLNPPHRYPLNKGEMLRFGKLCLRFKSLNLINSKGEPIKNEDRSCEKNDGHKIVKQIEGEDLECRICMEAQSQTDPFLDICDCARTMPVHLTCIRQWLKAKCEESQSTNTIFYDLKNIKCEVCNTSYPLTIAWNKKIHVLFNTELGLHENYAIFEMFEKNSSELKGMTVLFFKSNNMEFNVGRSVDNDIVFNDVSVSRVHAKIYFHNNKLEIMDCKSKFGTHKKITEIFFEKDRKDIRLQMEKFYFKVHKMKGKSCYCGTKNYDQIDPLTDFNKLKNIFGEYVADEELKKSLSLSAKDEGEDEEANRQVGGVLARELSIQNIEEVVDKEDSIEKQVVEKEGSDQNLHTSWRQNSEMKKKGSPVNLCISNNSLMNELKKDNTLFNFKTQNKISSYEARQNHKNDFNNSSMFSNGNVSQTSFQFD